MAKGMLLKETIFLSDNNTFPRISQADSLLTFASVCGRGVNETILGSFQTSNFTCAEFNANEKNILFSLICRIRFDTCKVRRLKRALERQKLGYNRKLSQKFVLFMFLCMKVFILHVDIYFYSQKLLLFMFLRSIVCNYLQS